jgi:hypothetical protein
LAMALSWLLMALLFRSALASAMAGACMAMVGVYILTRPNPAQIRPAKGAEAMMGSTESKPSPTGAVELGRTDARGREEERR